MNNLVISFKKFITNKNTVTVVGVIAILALLYWSYNTTIEEKTSPTLVPVATVSIQPRTLITDDMVQYIKIPGDAIDPQVLTSTALIVGKYTNYNTVIPKGSMFYEEVVVSEASLPGSAFVNLGEGERPYSLDVNIDSTYGNSIFPGDIVDIYMKANNELGQVMVGRLFSNVKILAVKDSRGRDVFEDATEDRTPDSLLIGALEDEFILLKKTEYLKSLGVELFPVPNGEQNSETGLIVGRDELIDYINTNSHQFGADTLEPEFEAVE